MNKYIKINQNNEIIDVFFEYQKNKFDGTEILLETTDKIKHKINGKSISNEYGLFIFQYNNGSIVEKNQTEIDLENQPFAKQEVLQALQATDIDNIRIIDDIIEYIENGTPIPQAAKDKINYRKSLREQI